MRQESTKEPVVALVGRFLCRGSFMKKGKRRRMRASSPRSSFSPFSVCFANPRSVAPRTAALLTCAFGERQLRLARSFRRSENGVPRGRNHTSGRQARTAAPSGRAKRAEKEREDHRIELARIREILSLFRIACRNNPTKRLVFGRVLGRSFFRKSCLPNVPHINFSSYAAAREFCRRA